MDVTWEWGRLARICRHYIPVCILCLRVQRAYFRVLGVSSCLRTRRSRCGKRHLPLDGLSLPEYEVFSAESQIFKGEQNGNFLGDA